MFGCHRFCDADNDVFWPFEMFIDLTGMRDGSIDQNTPSAIWNSGIVYRLPKLCHIIKI